MAAMTCSDMAWIPPHEFTMGSNDFYPEERPAHRVRVSGFWMDRHPVSNAEFARFIAETGYVTTAERIPNPADYPSVDPAVVVAGSLVFRRPERRAGHRDPGAWWAYVAGASWQHPEGPGSGLEGRENHPLVHVSHEDAAAFAAWAGKQLPSEAEWEGAARGGLEDAAFVWGNEMVPGGRLLANTWQGAFPFENLTEDGYEGTSPVGMFPPNGYGLFDMAGNVWEWTDDWFAPFEAGVARSEPCCVPEVPRAAAATTRDVAAIPMKVVKGGSHLCAPNYCLRFRPAARQPQAVESSSSHIGFRCILRTEEGAAAGMR